MKAYFLIWFHVGGLMSAGSILLYSFLLQIIVAYFLLRWLHRQEKRTQQLTRGHTHARVPNTNK